MPTEELNNRQDFADSVSDTGTAFEELADNAADVLSTSPEFGSLTNGLVAYYPMENTTKNIIRDGALDNDGVDNTSAGYVEGKVGSLAKDFDGTDDFVDTNFTGPDGAFTVSAFINLNENTNEKVASTKEDSDRFDLWVISGNIEAYVDDGTTLLNAVGGSIPTGEWIHVAMVFDGDDTVRVFKDGTESASDTDVNFTTRNPSENIVIGRESTNSQYHLNGAIDDVRIYDRALSQPEIEALSELDQPSGLRYDEAGEFDSLDSGIARYEFEQDVSDSFGSNDGTDNTSAGFVDGIYGQAKDFDGTDDYVDTGISQFTDTNTWTTSVWFNSDLANPAEMFISNDPGGVGGDPARVSHYITDSGEVFGVVEEDGTSDAATVSSQPLTANTWYNSQLVRDGTDVYLYINGSLVDSADASSVAADTSNTESFEIGRRPSDANYFSGQIDDVRIYDKALTAVEVERLYHKGAHRINRGDVL